MNPSFCQASGYNEAELTFRHYTTFIHPDDQATTSKALVRINSHQLPVVLKIDFDLKTPDIDGMSWNGFLLDENGLIHCVARDISGLKAADAHLLQTIEENKNRTNFF